MTGHYQTPLIINDRVDIALAIDADGVHVGQDDLPVATVRRLIGADKLIGVSVSNLKETQKALKDDADYLGVGAMYATDTKTDAAQVSFSELSKIRKATDLPIVVIGGLIRQVYKILEALVLMDLQSFRQSLRNQILKRRHLS